MNLYEINQAILDCVDMETGEIIDEERLAELRLEKDTKIENVALWIKNLKAEEKAIKEEEQKFRQRRTAITNKMNSLKGYLREALGYSKFKTAKVSIYYQNRQSVDIADGLDLSKLDESLVRVSYEPRKTEMKKALEDGVEIDGVTLVTNTSVVVR